MRGTDDIDELHASLLRTLASANRLRIIHLLGTGPREVNELARELGLGQAAASQHLAAMRAAGLVRPLREGRTVRYCLADQEIFAACSHMRGVLVRRLARLGDLAAEALGPADFIVTSSTAGRPRSLARAPGLDAPREGADA